MHILCLPCLDWRILSESLLCKFIREQQDGVGFPLTARVGPMYALLTSIVLILLPWMLTCNTLSRIKQT